MPFSDDFLLVVSAHSSNLLDGQWRFVIESSRGEPVMDVSDAEPGDLNRLTLLAAVRGLEAFDGGSSVTLLSQNRYLIRSLTDALPRWRRNNFVWDHFGRRIEVQHADLWRRIDRAVRIHTLRVCLITSRVISSHADRDPDSSRNAGSSQANSTTTSAAMTRHLWARIDKSHADPQRGLVPAPKFRRHRVPLATNDGSQVTLEQSDDSLDHAGLSKPTSNDRFA
ncbi:MAG: ribonuclease HI [Planctomycetota bacterium]